MGDKGEKKTQVVFGHSDFMVKAEVETPGRHQKLRTEFRSKTMI